MDATLHALDDRRPLPFGVRHERTSVHVASTQHEVKAAISGASKVAKGAKESCEARLSAKGKSATLTYTFDVARHEVSCGERPTGQLVRPDKCEVLFREKSDAWCSRVGLGGKAAAIQFAGSGPYVEDVDQAQCELQWTGPLAAD